MKYSILAAAAALGLQGCKNSSVRFHSNFEFRTSKMQNIFDFKRHFITFCIFLIKFFEQNYSSRTTSSSSKRNSNKPNSSRTVSPPTRRRTSLTKSTTSWTKNLSKSFQGPNSSNLLENLLNRKFLWLGSSPQSTNPGLPPASGTTTWRRSWRKNYLNYFSKIFIKNLKSTFCNRNEAFFRWILYQVRLQNVSP